MSKPETVFRIIFQQNQQIYELYAREVRQASLSGFIEIGQIIFGERSKLLVDPAEEKLKQEFGNFKHSHIPYQPVIRIDEVNKHEKNRIHGQDGAQVTPFPGSTACQMPPR